MEEEIGVLLINRDVAHFEEDRTAPAPAGPIHVVYTGPTTQRAAEAAKMAPTGLAARPRPAAPATTVEEKRRNIIPAEDVLNQTKPNPAEDSATSGWDGSHVLVFIPTQEKAATSRPLESKKPFKVNLQLSLRDRVENVTSNASIPVNTQTAGSVPAELEEEIQNMEFDGTVNYESRRNGRLSLDESVMANAAKQKVDDGGEGYTGGLFSWYNLETRQGATSMRLSKVRDVIALKPQSKVTARGELSLSAKNKILGRGQHKVTNGDDGGDNDGPGAFLGDFFDTEEDQLYLGIASGEAKMQSALGQKQAAMKQEEGEGSDNGDSVEDLSSSNNDESGSDEEEAKVGEKRNRKEGDDVERKSKKQRTESAPTGTGMGPPAVIPPKAPEDLEQKCAEFVQANKGRPALGKDKVINAILKSVADFTRCFDKEPSKELKKEWYRVAKSSVIRILPTLGCDLSGSDVGFPK